MRLGNRAVDTRAPENVSGQPGSKRRKQFEKVRKQALAALKKQFHNRPGIPGFMSEKAMEKHSDFRLLKGDSADLKKFKSLVRKEMMKIDPSLFGTPRDVAQHKAAARAKAKTMTKISTGRGPGILGSKMNASDRKAILAYNKSKRDEMTPEDKKVDYQGRVKKFRGVAKKAKKAEASGNLKQFAKDMMSSTTNPQKGVKDAVSGAKTATAKAKAVLKRMKTKKKDSY